MFFERVRRWIQFRVEQFLLGGAHYRVLLIVAAIGVLSAASGALVLALERHHFGVEGFGDAVWWAFLRLTDPGYLGDDEGGLRRTVSTVLTVTGYVLFMGALVATMTQGLNDKIRELERGYTPVALKNHIIVVGWNASTPELLAELTSSWERVRRFLLQHRASDLRIAVLAEEVGPSLEQALRERLGDRYNRSMTILRSGSALQPAHWARVDFERAAVIVFTIPERAREKTEASDDAQLAKAIITLSLHLKGREHIPIVVAAVSDPLKLEVIRATYPAARAEIFSSSFILARMLVRFARHPGLSHVIDEVLSQQYGSEFYLFRLPELEGRTFGELVWHYEDAIILGVMEETSSGPRARFGFRLDEPIPSRCSVIMLAADESPRECTIPAPLIEKSLPPLPAPEHSSRKALILGWNERLPWLLSEFDQDREFVWRVTVAATAEQALRDREIALSGVQLSRAEIRNRVCDVTALNELRSLEVASFDSVIVLASDLLESAEDADARTLLIHQMLRTILRKRERAGVRILVELRDPANADLFELTETEVIPSSVLVSHVLAQVALRPELRHVFDALFTRSGPEIGFLSPAALGVTEPMSFGELMGYGALRGVVVLGVRLQQHATELGGVILNPSRDTRYALTRDDSIVVLFTVSPSET